MIQPKSLLLMIANRRSSLPECHPNTASARLPPQAAAVIWGPLPRPINEAITVIGFAAGSYGSRNEDGEHYRSYFGGLGMAIHIDKHNSINLMAFIMDNNTYLNDPDKRFLDSYTWQFE